MRADNTQYLRDAVQRRQRQARERATAALTEFKQRQQPVTVAGLARAARVARSWIYSQPDLLGELKDMRTAPASPVPVRTRASEESWRQRLELAHQRISASSTPKSTRCGNSLLARTG